MGVGIKNKFTCFIILLQVHILGILYRNENEVLLLVATWKNLINMILNERSQLQKKKVLFNSISIEILKKTKVIYGVRRQESGQRGCYNWERGQGSFF